MEISGPLQRLCTACGLCCNGVIFADVQLLPGDPVARLQRLGIAPPPTKKPSSRPIKINQPCPALATQCTVYANRPCYCRQFECVLFKNLASGKIKEARSLKIIATAQKRAERVRKLLRKLGDTEETLSLSKRFRRVQKRVETSPINDETADLYGDLTLAVHDMNFLLSQAFYPGA